MMVQHLVQLALCHILDLLRLCDCEALAYPLFRLWRPRIHHVDEGLWHPQGYGIHVALLSGCSSDHLWTIPAMACGRESTT